MFNFGLIQHTTDTPHDDRVEVMVAQTRAWIEQSHAFDVLGRYETAFRAISSGKPKKRSASRASAPNAKIHAPNAMKTSGITSIWLRSAETLPSW